MEIVSELKSFPKNIPLSLGIGNFDGLHVGHQKIVEGVLNQARKLGTQSAILTFHPHPQEILHPDKKFQYLFTLEEKKEQFRKMNIDWLCIMPFDKQTALLSPEDFFTKIVRESLNAVHVQVGFNFFFGHNRSGDTALLRKLCEKAHISVGITDQIELDQQRVNSSWIRRLIVNGNVEQAALFLTRPYSLTGKVVRGDKRGSRIGFPTANMEVPDHKLLPKNGVYITVATVGSEKFGSVTNIGERPTFKDGPAMNIETHILEGSHDLYDAQLRIELLRFLRPEQKFDGVDSLVAQIKMDVKSAKDYFLNANG